MTAEAVLALGRRVESRSASYLESPGIHNELGPIQQSLRIIRISATMGFMSVPNRDLPSVQKGPESRQFNIGIMSIIRREEPERTSRVTPKAAASPLKGLDLTEGQTFGIPSARLGFASARFGFPSDWLGFPSAQLGIPSVRLGTACGLAERPRLRPPLVPSGAGRPGNYLLAAERR
jgi:hypothetical protein